MDLTNSIDRRRFGAQLFAAWDLGFHSKQPSHDISCCSWL